MSFIRKLTVLLISLFLFLSVTSTSLANSTQIQINDQVVNLDDSIIQKQGRSYVPVRFITEYLDSNIKWNSETNQIEIIANNGDSLIFTVNDSLLSLNNNDYYMDVSTIMENGRIYLPARHLAEFLHTEVGWDIEQEQIVIKTIPLHTVSSGETLDYISKQYNVPKELLLIRNGLLTETLTEGQQLKIVIPTVMQNVRIVSEEEIELLAKIISAEAGYEPYDGQVAVGNVILNRVDDERFPNTIKDVIYATNQFTPVKTGDFETIQPSEESIRAAQEVLAGKSVVEDALYFFNPTVSKSDFFNEKEVVKEIGGHRFVK